VGRGIAFIGEAVEETWFVRSIRVREAEREEEEIRKQIVVEGSSDRTHTLLR